jgi:hypothetical protein
VCKRTYTPGEMQLTAPVGCTVRSIIPLYSATNEAGMSGLMSPLMPGLTSTEPVPVPCEPRYSWRSTVDAAVRDHATFAYRIAPIQTPSRAQSARMTWM